MNGLINPVGSWFHYAAIHKLQLLCLLLCSVALFWFWFTYWKTRFTRLMKMTFERTGLYLTVSKASNKSYKLFPRLIKLSDQEDLEYYVFEYRLPIGMTAKAFEEKKKYFETAFDAKALVTGEGAYLSIKIKKEKLHAN